MILQDFFVFCDTTSSSFILRTNFSFIFALAVTYWRVLHIYLNFKWRFILKVILFFKMKYYKSWNWWITVLKYFISNPKDIIPVFVNFLPWSFLWKFTKTETFINFHHPPTENFQVPKRWLTLKYDILKNRVN